MSTVPRQTKIICTIGPATEKPETMLALILAGANIFRLNMSHAKPEWIRMVARNAREAAEHCGRNIAILMDLCGPAIRTGEVEGKIALLPGDRVEFRLGDSAPTLPYSTTVNYPGLGGDVKVGDELLLDNGVLQMRIVAVDEERVIAEAVSDGELGSRRHINLPGVKVNLPPLTDKDLEDIKLGLDIGVDFFAMSFVRDAAHMRLLRDIIKESGSRTRIIAKIEDQQAILKLDEIIEASDVVMVARGDLGIEVHVEELPALQRRIVRRCTELGRLVIVATHMMESMIENPVPTRAEVTDVANAVFEEADAVMLSGETSVGEFPVRCVQILDRICRRAETEPGADFHKNIVVSTDKQKLAKSAVYLTDHYPNACLLVFTLSGAKGQLVAQQRPRSAPVFAFSPDLEVCRFLAMARAVQPFLLEYYESPDSAMLAGIAMLKERGLIQGGETLVILTDVLQEGKLVNALLLRPA